MPIQHALWTVGSKPTPLPVGRMAREDLLEEMIVAEPSILSAEWMLIGRQVSTPYSGRIDILAIAPDASLVIIELKRNRTPREVVAQSLDYAAWVDDLAADQIVEIYRRFQNGGNLGEDFRRRFNAVLDEESLNASHQIVIVAAELDDASERIVRYLNERDLAVNIVFFRIFEANGTQLLSRAWFIDPGQTQANVVATEKRSGEKEPWNGEFYVSFGTSAGRTWKDARQYGYISAGNGLWYTRSLKLLSPGDRVWVKDPGVGYLGVGRVLEPAVSMNDFKVQTPAGEKPCLEVLESADELRRRAKDPEKAEHFVRVQWLDTVSESEAVNEVGLFGNQNSVCQPTTPKWRHTVERLKSRFPKWNQ